MKFPTVRSLAAIAAAACLGFAVSQSMGSVVIIGGLGNFDVYNHEGTDCNEFEIELERGVRLKRDSHRGSR